MLSYLCIIYLHIIFTTLVGSPNLVYQLRKFLHWRLFFSSLEKGQQRNDALWLCLPSSYFTLKSSILLFFHWTHVRVASFIFTCFTWCFVPPQFSARFRYCKNWYSMYYIYRRRTLPTKKTSCSEFFLYSPNPMEKTLKKQHAQNVCPPKIDVYKKYAPKHKVRSLGQKIQPTKNQLAIIHPINLFLPNFSWMCCCWNFLFSQFFFGFFGGFSPKFSTFEKPLKFWGSSFPRSRPWNFSIFASPVPRQRPNVPGPQGWSLRFVAWNPVLPHSKD